MRHLVFIFMIMGGCVVDAAAQQQTSAPNDVERGAYYGPVVKFTQIHDQAAVMLGGGGGWNLSDSLALGLGGYVGINHVDAPIEALSLEGPLDIKFLYGGIELEYFIYRSAQARIGLSGLLGGAANNYVRDLGARLRSDEQVGETDFGMVLEPGMNAGFRVTPWFHIDPGVSYRLVTGVDQVALQGRDFNGLAATVAFKFGTF